MKFANICVHTMGYISKQAGNNEQQGAYVTRLILLQTTNTKPHLLCKINPVAANSPTIVWAKAENGATIADEKPTLFFKSFLDEQKISNLKMSKKKEASDAIAPEAEIIFGCFESIRKLNLPI